MKVQVNSLCFILRRSAQLYLPKGNLLIYGFTTKKKRIEILQAHIQRQQVETVALEHEIINNTNDRIVSKSLALNYSSAIPRNLLIRSTHFFF